MQAYSVLMAVYKGDQAPFLRQAVESMLAQSAAPAEILLVCDGPLTPELEEEISHLQVVIGDRLQVLRLPENRGLGAALNAGLRHCRHDLVARMDADDLALPDRMAHQLQAMEAYPEAAVIGGQIAEFREDPQRPFSYRTVLLEPEAVRRFARCRTPMNHVTVLCRREALLRVGGYPEFSGPGFEDYYLWIKLLARGYVLRNIPQLCCKVRVSGAQYSRRGGWGYFQNALAVQRLLRKEGMVSPVRFCCSCGLWFVSSLVLSAGMRRQVCLGFLRRKQFPSPEPAVMSPVFGEISHEAAHSQP